MSNKNKTHSEKENEIYGIEKQLIRKHRKLLGKIKPRPVKILSNMDADTVAEAASSELRINERWLEKQHSRQEKEKLVLHELIHYTKHPHDEYFLKLAKKLGITDKYVLHEFLDEALSRLDGRMEERFQRDGSIRIVMHRKPDWKRFRNGLLYSSSNSGLLFRRLRERYGCSRKAVAKRAGLSEYRLNSVEHSKEMVTVDEQVLKRIFYAITRHSSRSSWLPHKI